MRETFDHFDVTKDGKLDFNEFWSCVTGLGQTMDEPDVKAAFTELDVSGEGLIDLEEFTPFMVQMLTQPGYSQDECVEAFKQLANPHPKYFPITKSIKQQRIEKVFHDEESKVYMFSSGEETKMPATDGVNMGVAEMAAYDYEPFTAQLFTV